MNFRHAFVSLAALVGLAACSDEDTIVSLNVSSSGAVPVIDTLRVTITQGSKQHVTEFAPPTETPTAPEGQVAAPPSIVDKFFQRITLPGEWSETDAKVAVEALHSNGAPYDPPFAANTVAVIQPEDVVAAYVKLDVPAPETPPGDGGAGGDGAGGDSAGTGGQSTGGQSTGGQSTGGQSTGGQSTGGQSTGGQSTGGAGGAPDAGAGGS